MKEPQWRDTRESYIKVLEVRQKLGEIGPGEVNKISRPVQNRDLFPCLRKVDFNKINQVGVEVFGLKSGLKSTADALGTYKELHRIFLTMLYRREVLRKAKKWSNEKEKLWLSICPKPFSHGINPYYFHYLKLHEEICDWDEKPVRATA